MKVSSVFSRRSSVGRSISSLGGFCRTAGFVATLLLWGHALQAGPVVIAHKSVSPDVVIQTDLQQVFLGKKTTWPGGQTIQFAVLPNGPLHESFLVEKVKKNPSQFTQYWKTAMFSGRGKMPPEMDTEAAMLKFVAETPGAIGYVSSEYAAATDLSAVSAVAE